MHVGLELVEHDVLVLELFLENILLPLNLLHLGGDLRFELSASPGRSLSVRLRDAQRRHNSRAENTAAHSPART